MVVFCLAYLIAIRVPVAVGWGVRAVVGPIDAPTWEVFSPWEDALGMALSLALIGALIAAAVDRVVGRDMTVRAGSPIDIGDSPGGTIPGTVAGLSTGGPP